MPAVARLIADYDAFVDAIRERGDEMGMTRLKFDHQAGTQEGYSEKILEPKHVKIFGMKSLGDTLGAIGCKLLLVEDSNRPPRCAPASRRGGGRSDKRRPVATLSTLHHHRVDNAADHRKSHGPHGPCRRNAGPLDPPRQSEISCHRIPASVIPLS
jgi:hypothetical protein